MSITTIDATGAPTSKPMCDLDAERAALGAMMLSQSAADIVIMRLDGDDFYRPVHGTIYHCLASLIAAGEPTDAINLAHALDARGELGRVGGAPYLHELISCVPTAAQAGHFADIVAGWSKRRRVLESATVVARAATDLSKPVDEMLDDASRVIHEATMNRHDSSLRSVNDIADDEFEHLEAVSRGEIPPGITTGFIDLDALIGGWQPGQLVIPAARPGVGKSLTALCWALSAAEAGHPVLMFTMEMKAREVNRRLWSNVGRVPLHLFKNGNFRDDDWRRIREAREHVRTLPIHIDDQSNTVAQIQGHSRRFAQQHGKPGLVIVDYLQRLNFPNSGDRHDLQVGQAAKDLKTLAQELDTTVIAVCQLNRGPEQRQDKRPVKSDLRDSGQLEQEADIVILIHRDELYDRESPRSGEADLIVDKNRDGPTDTITVAAQPHIARFVDMAIV